MTGIAFETCSNVLKISYRTSQGPNSQYRGFNLYYEISNPGKFTLSLFEIYYILEIDFILFLTFSVNASVALKQDICAGSSVTLKCESNPLTNYTILINDAFYGIKQPSSTYCGYK